MGVRFHDVLLFFRFNIICSLHFYTKSYTRLTLLSLSLSHFLSLSLSLFSNISLTFSLLRRVARITFNIQINFDSYTIVSPRFTHHKNSHFSLSLSLSLSISLSLFSLSLSISLTSLTFSLLRRVARITF